MGLKKQPRREQIGMTPMQVPSRPLVLVTQLIRDVLEHEVRSAGHRLQMAIGQLQQNAANMQRLFDTNNYDGIPDRARNAGQHLADASEAAGKIYMAQLVLKILNEEKTS